MLQIMVAEWWAGWLGIELNATKREPPRSTTRHLGFHIDLIKKIVTVTDKHRRKVIAFFDRFLLTVRKNGRIPIRDIQKLLGLQIWISTVFRVTRQFLTSICDILRIAGRQKFFYPRQKRDLARRAVFDLKF